MEFTSENHHQDLIVISTDKQGLVTVFNQSAVDILGYTQAEILGNSLPLANINTLLNAGVDASNPPYFAEITHKNGQVIPIELITSPIKDEQGQFSGVLFTAKQVKKMTPHAHHTLPNQSIFELILNREIRRTEREAQPLVLLEVAMDDYAMYQSTYGINAAEQAKTLIVDVLVERIQRASDFLAEGNANQFYVLLPNTDRPGAVKVAEQLRLLVANIQDPTLPTPKISVSIGLFYMQPERTTENAVYIQGARKALEEAIQAGGNCSRF